MKRLIVAIFIVFVFVFAISSCSPDSADTSGGTSHTVDQDSLSDVTSSGAPETSEGDVQHDTMEPIIDTDTGWGPLIPMTPVE